MTSDNPPASEVEPTLAQRVEKVVRDHFYPGPVAGSTARLTAALIAEFGLSPQPSRPQGEEGWRPISEAPRDGTDVLLCASSYVFIGRCVGDIPHKSWRERKGGVAYPTHWQPLPAPPSALSNPQHGEPS